MLNKKLWIFIKSIAYKWLKTLLLIYFAKISFGEINYIMMDLIYFFTTNNKI